jgi:ribosomal protein S18 acetylase RimI-like enzyme
MIHDAMERNERISIVPAVPEDAPGIFEVQYQTWKATYPNERAGVTLADIEERFREKEQRIARAAEHVAHPREGQSTFVAKEGARVIGIIRVEAGEGHNELVMLYVLPEMQGRGVGGALWREAQTMFDSSKDTFVNVADYNERAIRFYEHLGFRDTGEVVVHPHFVMPISKMQLREKRMKLAR